MNSMDTARDVAVLWTLDFDAELPCEGNHVSTECSGIAKWVNNACVGSILVCENGAIGKMNRMRSNPSLQCKECMELASECWSIRPI